MIDFFATDRSSSEVEYFDEAACQQRRINNVGLAAFTALIHSPSQRVLLVQLGDYARGNLGGNPWTLPGGKVEADERPSVGACRELLEETGVSVHIDELRLVACFNRPYISPTPHSGELISLFVAPTDKIVPFRNAAPEIIAASFCSFDYDLWLKVPETGENTHSLQPLRRHWIFWTYLCFKCLSQDTWRPYLWTYENAATMRSPPWHSQPL